MSHPLSNLYASFIHGSIEEKTIVRSKSRLREKTSKSDPAEKRYGAMLVPGKRFEANKKAVLLNQEKNHYFVFILKKYNNPLE